MRPKFELEIDCGGAEASGYEDRLPWVSYGTICAEGNSLEECLENACVDLVDQDGGSRGLVDAHCDWMQALIERAFMDKYKPDGTLRQWTRVCLQFDECKPHWATKARFDRIARELGLQDVLVTGDFDMKLTYIYGKVECFEAFENAWVRSALEPVSSLYQTYDPRDKTAVERNVRAIQNHMRGEQ